MPGWIRRAESLGDALANQRTTGPHSSPGTPPVTTIAPTHACFRAEGDYWTVSYDGTTVRLKGGRGMVFLSMLLQAPGVDIASSELAIRAARAPAKAGGSAVGPADVGDAGELLDARARARYKQRLLELREELAEADGFNDSGRSEQLREEIEFITAELSRAVGLGGRERRGIAYRARASERDTRDRFGVGEDRP